MSQDKEKRSREAPSGKDAAAATSSNTPALVENLFAPEVYADSAAFFALKGGNLSITFSSVRFDNSSVPGVAKHVIVGRLVMPAPTGRLLANGILDYLKKQGLMPGRCRRELIKPLWN